MTKKSLSLRSASLFYFIQMVLSFSPDNIGFVRSLAGTYSRLLEQHVSPRQTLHLLNVQVALLLLLITAQAPLLFFFLLTVWFLAALYGCVRSFQNVSQNASKFES